MARNTVQKIAVRYIKKIKNPQTPRETVIREVAQETGIPAERVAFIVSVFCAGK